MDHLLLLLLLLWSSGLGVEGNHDSTGSQCKTTAKADIMLLVHGFQSMDFGAIRSFITDIVSVFDIGPDRIQIGLTQYSRGSNTEWYLNTHQTKQSLLRAIANLPYRGEDILSEEFLNSILQYNFKTHVGMRADSQKIAVLITGGKLSARLRYTSQPLKDAGIEIYAIGVKDTDESELRSTVSDPAEVHMYYVKELRFLPDIVNNLIINLCNSANSFGRRNRSSLRSAWRMSPRCVQPGYALKECSSSSFSSTVLEIICSDSVRLVNGTSLCSGRLEVKTHQSNQWWSSVCEADFDLQDAEVVCRELGCGAPSVLQGALYGEVEAPMWTKEFQCGGQESALLDCRSSGSARTTCSPGKAVGLTCSEQVCVRLVGGASRCAEPAHQGDYTCVYHVYVFSHNFSSESRRLSLTVSDPTALIIRLVVLPLSLLLVNAVIYFICKATRGQKPGPQENMELDVLSRAEGGPAEEEGVQEAE
ncbi:scavenger receptor cysteine-rich type 1 protein M130-like isoform X4 [Lates japonicus]|uniref:Scavenger receptor cysteine-rich type 1 protein M130-like isoform X4 n=1 Tax=Lates japonicus TaxID=270547 RepID=A0AAD3MML3_LATJO|nr:scavenger receptor cysteine-rich type 1 protein M130-like isoform X4 [Lates japonicus]